MGKYEMSCYLCGSNYIVTRPGKVRDDETLEILECQSCGLVFLSSQKHIDLDYYETSKMHKTAENYSLDKWLSETNTDDNRRITKYANLIKNKSILDFGCGNAGFLLLARELAGKAIGIELELALQPYFMEKNLCVYTNLDQLEEKIDYIFLNHVIEHINDPITLLKKLKTKINPGGVS